MNSCNTPCRTFYGKSVTTSKNKRQLLSGLRTPRTPVRHRFSSEVDVYDPTSAAEQDILSQLSGSSDSELEPGDDYRTTSKLAE